MESDKDLSRYQNGKIYSIRSHQTDKYYIGSSCLDLCKRLYNHRVHYKMYLNKKYNYMSSFEIIKYDDHYIEIIEDYPCNTHRELQKREGELHRQYKNEIVNRYLASNTIEEMKIDQNKIHEEWQIKNKLNLTINNLEENKIYINNILNMPNNEFDMIKEKKPTLSAKTLTNYKNIYLRLRDLFKNENISTLSNSEIIKGIDEYKNTPAVKQTLLNVAIVLKQVFDLNVEPLIKKRTELIKDIKNHVVDVTNKELKETLPTYKQLVTFRDNLFKDGKFTAYIGLDFVKDSISKDFNYHEFKQQTDEIGRILTQ